MVIEKFWDLIKFQLKSPCFKYFNMVKLICHFKRLHFGGSLWFFIGYCGVIWCFFMVVSLWYHCGMWWVVVFVQKSHLKSRVTLLYQLQNACRMHYEISFFVKLHHCSFLFKEKSCLQQFCYKEMLIQKYLLFKIIWNEETGEIN